MVVVVTVKNDEDPIKNEGPRILTTLNINFQTFKDRHGQGGHTILKIKFPDFSLNFP